MNHYPYHKYSKMVTSLSYQFSNNDRERFEENRSICNLKFVEACNNYNPEKGQGGNALLSFLYVNMKNALINQSQQIAKEKKRHNLSVDQEIQAAHFTSEGVYDNSSNNIENKYDELQIPFHDYSSLNETLLFLSEEAQTVAKLILNAPKELELFLHEKKISMSNSKCLRGGIKRYLREKLGWQWKSIWTSFRELKTVFS